MTSMGENLAVNLVSEASKGLFIFAKRHVCYCFQFKSHIKHFQMELENLESTRNDALERERSICENNEEITDVAKNWLGNAKDLLDAADELNKKTEKQGRCVIGWCPKCFCRYGLGKKAAKMTLELNKHNTSFKYDNFSRPAPRLGMEFHAPINFINLDSRKVAYDQLWNALQDDQNLSVGVYAMGGSGKTTLVRELGYRAEKENMFDKVVFVVVSNPPDVRRIQENIASQLGLIFGNNQESDRARELWLRLTKGEKTLLILDDIWEKLDFKSIGIPFDDKHKNCRILLTTRRVDICTSVECQLKIELSVLTEEDSWRLFQKYANLSSDSYIPLDVAKEIVSECKGLPVAIAIVASTLKDNEPQDWEDALTTLKNAEPLIGTGEHLIEIYNCLRLSYAHLKSREVQELFLLCSFFPEDYEIPMEDLTRYAVGLRLFGDDRSFKKARRLAHKAKRTLTDSCLLTNVELSKGECVKMHDLIREVAQWIGNREIKEVFSSKIDETALDRTRYLWFHVTNGLPNQLNYPKLEILMISVENNELYAFFQEKEKEEFFRGLDNLHVLILTSVSFRVSMKLPQSIQVLNCLRTLNLNRWKLGNIYVLGTLKSLESLELSCCEIDELPSGLVELKNLRLLDLSHCKILQNPFLVIGRLAQLEELYYFTSLWSRDSLPWQMDGENICYYFGENCQLKKLERYRIQIGSLIDELHENLIPRGLSIDRVHPSSSNATIKYLVGRAEYLFLKEIQGGYKTVVPDVVGAIGGKIEWIKLSLNYCNDIECLVNATNVLSHDATALSELVELKVIGMANLKELYHGRPPSGFLEKLQRLFVRSCDRLHSILFVGNLNLCCLKVVKVKNCSMLTSLFTVSIALSLLLLEELQVSSCSGLRYIIADEREWETGNCNQKLSSASVFQKLKSVVFFSCQSLEFIFPVCLAGKLVQLEEIRIRDANILTHVFGQYQDGVSLHQNDEEIMLPSLQKFELHGIPNFNSIFPVYSHPNGYPQVESTNLEATTPMELHLSQVHTTTWYTSTFQCRSRKFEATSSNATTSRELHALQNTVRACLSKQLLNMSHVKEMDLKYLPTEVVSLFTFSAAQNMLVKKLTICGCQGLRHIINGEVDFDHNSYVSIFPELRVLTVQYCNLLEFIFPACFPQYPAKLEYLTIKRAPELKSIFGHCYHDNHSSHQRENMIHKEQALKELYLRGCPQLRTKSMNDLMISSHAREPDCITTKAIQRHDDILSIEKLLFESFGIEGIFLMEGLLMEEKQEQLTSRLEELELEHLYELKNICLGPLQCLFFQNLINVKVIGCENLSCIFSISVVRSLPQLKWLTIKNCNKLKQIIEDDEENQILSKNCSRNVCFPNLNSIRIEQCNKLRYLFFISQSEFPKLNDLFVQEASQLDEIFRWKMGDNQYGVNTLFLVLKCLTLKKLPCLTNICQGFNFETAEKLQVKGCPRLLLGYGHEKGEEIAIGDRYDTYSPTLPPSSLFGSNASQNQEGSPNGSGSVESNTIDQKESRDAAPQISSHFSSGTSAQTCTTQAINMNEKFKENSSDSPSSNFPSDTSDDSPKELFMSTVQYNVTTTEEAKEIVRKRKWEIVQKSSASEKPGMELADEQLLSVPILMHQRHNTLSETKIATEIPPRFFNTASNENIGGKVQQGFQESSISEKAIIVTLPIEKAFPQNINGSIEDFHTTAKGKRATSPLGSEAGSSMSASFVTPLHETSAQSIIEETSEEIVQKCPTTAKPAIVTSSTESEFRRTSPSSVLVEITVGHTKTSIALPLITSLIPYEHQNEGEGSKALSTSITQFPTPPWTSLLSSVSLHPIHGSLLEDSPLSSSLSQCMVTLAEEHAAFRDIGVILKKKHIPLLEKAMVKHPFLCAWHEKHKRPQMKQYGYTTLGDMLEFLASTKWRDLTQEKIAEFESLINDLETFGFDIQWLRNIEALIKPSKAEEEIMNRINTLRLQEMKQKIATEFLEDCLQKEVEARKSKVVDLDDIIGF